jgi:ABC-type lipoprotein release transport system permease subunit
MLVLFTLTTVALFWSMGISRSISLIQYHMFRDSKGDITFYLNKFHQKSSLDEVFKPYQLEKVVYERQISGFVDNEKISDSANIFELTPENRVRLKKWFYLSEGRLPSAADEVVVPEIIYRKTIKVGDALYLSAYTPREKILNTLHYRVVGIMKMAGLKGMSSFLITEDSMNQLINDSNSYNAVTIYDFVTENRLMEQEMKNKIESLATNILKDFKKKEFQSHWQESIIMFKSNNKFIDQIFSGINILAILLFFPLIGAILAVTIRMLAIKRTGEFATYIALGFRSFKIIKYFVWEIIMIALAGYGLGIILGILSKIIVEYNRIYINFSNFVSGPIMIHLYFIDYFYILLFMLALIIVWTVPIIKGIVSRVPARILRGQDQ